MPFVTEELWQRLPRRPGDKTPSIMVARYPVYETEFDDPESASQYEQIIASVKVARSLMESYAIREQANVKIQVEGKSLAALFNEQLQSISQLIGTKKIESITVVSENTEEGYAVSPVNSDVNVLLLVKGRVNLGEHLMRTEDKLAKSRDKLTKLQDQVGAAGYQAKVDADTKESDEEKLRNLAAEVETLDSFVASLRKMTIQ